MKEYFFGTGRRKTAIAQVRIFKGSGKVIFADGTEVTSAEIIKETSQPFEIVSQQGKFDISLVLKGGGFSSQAEAAKLGVARALSKIDESFEKTLKKEGLLTRDPREKERKKPGLKRARKSPQWAKR